MTGDGHVRLREGLGVRLPWATRRAPGMARSALSGAGNREAKADREVT